MVRLQDTTIPKYTICISENLATTQFKFVQQLGASISLIFRATSNASINPFELHQQLISHRKQIDCTQGSIVGSKMDYPVCSVKNYKKLQLIEI